MNTYEQLKEKLKTGQSTWLITGVAGFIGSNLLETLLNLNQKVVGMDNFSTGHQKNIDEAIAAANCRFSTANFHFLEGDIRNLDDCRKACTGIDYVLHQAALGSVPRSIEDPVTTNQNNIDGFLNMLVAARDAKVKRMVYAASSSTYGDHPDLPKIEEKIGKPLSPYAVTKVVNELYADVFAKTYDFKTIGLRYFNIFGKRQDPNGAYAAVIPKWFAGLINGETIYINGDGTTSRDFCYIDNCVQANIMAATVGSILPLPEGGGEGDTEDPANHVYNVAYGERTDLKELFELIKQQVVNKLPAAASAEPLFRDFRAGDVLHSLADISKAKKLIGYDPDYSIGEGMAEAAEWYLQQ